MVSISELRDKTVAKSPTQAAPSSAAAASQGNARPTQTPTREVSSVEELVTKTTMQAIDRDPNRSAYDMGQANRDRKNESNAAQQDSASLAHDFSKLQEGSPDEVQDWQNIAGLAVSLGATDDPQAQELMNALLWNYGEQLQPHVTALDAEWWDRNYTEPPEEEDDSFLGWRSKLGAASPLFEYLDQWGQSSLSALGGVTAAIDQGDDVSVGDGLRHAVRQGFSSVDLTRVIPGYDGVSAGFVNSGTPDVIRDNDGNVLKALDTDASGGLGAREAFGIAADAGGRWGGALDLIGSIILDPSTYATLGSSSLARLGMKGAEEVGARLAAEGVEHLGTRVSREMVQEMNQRIARSGFKALDEADQSFYTNLIRMANEEGAEGVGRTTALLGRDVADAQLSAVRRGGQDGLRLAGNTVLPSGGLIRDTLGRGSDEFAERIVPRAADDVADEVVDTATDVVPARGVDARGATDNVLTQVGGEIIDLPPSALREINELAEAIPTATRLSSEGAVDGIREVIRVGQTRGVIGQILDMPMIANKIKQLSPRHAVRAVFGDEVANQLGHLLSITREDPEVTEIMTRLGADMHRNGLMRQSVSEFADEETWSRKLNEVLTTPGEARTALLSDLGPKTTQLVETLQDVRERLRAVAIKGGATPENLRDFDTYIPRVLSDVAKRDASLLQRIKNAAGDNGVPLSGDRLTESFMQTRTVAENLDNLFESNAEAYRVLQHAGIETPEQLFETNVVAAFAARTRSAFQAASDVDLLDGIAGLVGNDGMSLGFRAADSEALDAALDAAGAVASDFRRVKLDNGQVFAVHNTIADELENVRRIFGDPKQMSDMAKFFDKMNNVWAMSATVMGVNPGFHVRNGIGNLFNAFITGTNDPTVFLRAGAMQEHARKITAAMRTSGDDWATVAARLEIPEETVQILSDARRLGVLGDGRSLDVLRDNAGVATKPSTGNRLNPTEAGSIWNKPGVVMGEAVEGNARLGVYLDQINKGASPETAARHVKSTLFDYGDLTRLENETVRRFSRFYTFMRKNTALQAYTLAHYPARIANAEAGVQGVLDLAFGGEAGEGGSLPPWMPDASIMNLPGGSQAALKVDTPFNSFEDVVQILTGPPSGDPLERLGAESYINGLINRTTDLFSGVGPGVIDFFNEQASGQDAFTGRTLDPENQVRDTTWFSALSTVFPAMSRFEGIAARNATINEAFGIRRDKDGNITGTAPGFIQLMNLASGVQTYEISEDGNGMARYTLQSELVEVMREMEEAGIEVPTIEELRESGEIAMRNRVLETLMYSWSEDENGELVWDNEGANAQLLQILPANVRDAFVSMGVLTPEELEAMDAAGNAPDKGSRPDVEEGSEAYYAQDDFDFNQALTAIETYLDRDLTYDEKWTMVSAFGGALGVTDQENAGFDPYRENRLLDGAEEAEVNDNARKEALFNQRLASVGMTWAEALERNPRISTMQRNMEDARAAGWTEEEIRTALYYATDEGGLGWTSRADRAAINQFMTGDRTGGAVPLTLTRNPLVSDEDLQKLQTKVWNAAEELRLIYQFEGWGTPSQQELFMYGVNNLTKTEQRMLGIDPLDSAPNREDIRSDAQKQADAENKLGAVTAGLNSPYRWEVSNQPDYAPWE